MPTDANAKYVAAPSTWPLKEALVLCAIFLAVGLALGYYFLGPKLLPSSPPQVATSAGPPVHGSPAAPHPRPTMEQMKQMAAVQTSALVEKLKTDPKNISLMIQIAAIYKSSHQFKEAADYYGRALKIDPKNVSARTEMASCLYYNGDVDGAISELKQSLKYSPKDANSLFNLGLITWKGKNDAAGAIAIWQELLKTNPDLDRKPIVEQMIAEARADGKSGNNSGTAPATK